MFCLLHECHRILCDHVERSYPREGCGILLGHRGELDDQVEQVIRCTNAASHPERQYEIAPTELIAAQRHARQAGLDILGFYHSHPNHTAQASETDLRNAHWTGCVYLICAVHGGKLAEIAAMRLLSPGYWKAEQVHIEPPGVLHEDLEDEENSSGLSPDESDSEEA